MGLVHSNQPFFTSPAQLMRQARYVGQQLVKPTEEPAPAPVSERANDPVIDWEQYLDEDRPIVPESDQWFLLLMLWWIATVMAAAQLGVL